MSTPRPSNGRTTTDSSILNSGDTSSAELTAVVDDLLNNVSAKFSTISSELLAKMDDMSRRLDNLEATIQTGDGSKGNGSGSTKREH